MHKFNIGGQTYSRQQDVQLIFALAAVGAACKKICLDVRVLQAMGELLEPFEEVFIPFWSGKSNEISEPDRFLCDALQEESDEERTLLRPR